MIFLSYRPPLNESLFNIVYSECIFNNSAILFYLLGWCNSILTGSSSLSSVCHVVVDSALDFRVTSVTSFLCLSADSSVQLRLTSRTGIAEFSISTVLKRTYCPSLYETWKCGKIVCWYSHFFFVHHALLTYYWFGFRNIVYDCFSYNDLK